MQDFYEGTYKSLESVIDKIRRYKKLHLSFPGKSGHPDSLVEGFMKFCRDYSISSLIDDSLENVEIIKEHAYLVIDDADLIKLLKVCKLRCWKPGLDVGVISYNETPLKEVIRDGITVISCSFKEMAAEMASYIKDKKAVNKTITINMINRNSL